ncbi:MAG: glucoamylase family protein [Enhygromyxa sp.]
MPTSTCRPGPDAQPIDGGTGGIGDDELLDTLEREAFAYFPVTDLPTGPAPDSTRPGAPISIAGVGLELTASIAAVARGWIDRQQARRHALATARLFARARQAPERDATGHRGFFYHFLDAQTLRRARRCELSSIDTGLLAAGLLTARQFFDRDDAEEAELRATADAIYRRIDWRWMLDGGPTLSHGWTPERGFLRARWAGYTEALLLYVLACGSPSFAIPPECYAASTAEYRWKTIYGHELLYAGPLFIHQLPQCWLDLRGLRDRWLGERGLDYFENSRRATQIQRRYAIRNPRQFRHYGPKHWGLSASDGPGPAVHHVDGRRVRFWDYRARGVPHGPDDGTVAPWAAVTSLPFAPELVIPTIRAFYADHLDDGVIDRTRRRPFGFEATVNFTFPNEDGSHWCSPYNYAINQGPLVVMVENYRTELIWKLLRSCDYVIAGLRAMGFSGGWLAG